MHEPFICVQPVPNQRQWPEIVLGFQGACLHKVVFSNLCNCCCSRCVHVWLQVDLAGDIYAVGQMCSHKDVAELDDNGAIVYKKDDNGKVTTNPEVEYSDVCAAVIGKYSSTDGALMWRKEFPEMIHGIHMVRTSEYSST